MPLKKRPKRTATGEPVDQIIIDPKLAKIGTPSETSMNEAIVTFGKFNPPHAGHERLIEHMRKLAEQKDADPLVFLSHREGVLDYHQKLLLCQMAFGSDVIVESEVNDLFQILENLDYKKITVVVGSDRFAEFSERLPQYFDNVEVVEFDRQGESSTALREAIWDGNFDGFTEVLPKALQPMADELFEYLQSSKPDKKYLKERAMALAWQVARPNVSVAEPTAEPKVSEKLRFPFKRMYKHKRILDSGAA